ncbi:hypothetical protein J4U51_25645, partial [Escherichia coli]
MTVNDHLDVTIQNRLIRHVIENVCLFLNVNKKPCQRHLLTTSQGIIKKAFFISGYQLCVNAKYQRTSPS